MPPLTRCNAIGAARMNPAALLLVLLSLGGLLLRRRDLGLAWVVCGLAAVALLGPALVLPDGVPSPAASLAHDPPWQGVADPAAGNDNLRDVTYQVEPWLLFMRRELRAGRLPLWDPYQSAGAPFWSNGSSAPLFPLHLLFALLPLQLGLVLLPWLRLVLAGCGAWALAAELGLSRPAALLAAVIYPLCGTVTSFLLYPMSNAHALLPWVFLAVERLAAGGGAALASAARSLSAPVSSSASVSASRVPSTAAATGRSPSLRAVAALAAAGGLQLLGGHPETAIYAALLTAIYLLVRGSPRPLAAWLGLAGGWALAGAIAAVQLLPLALTLPETSRWLAWTPPSPVPLGTVAGLLLRLVLPDLYGNPAHGTWWGPYNFAATAIYAGAAAPLLAAGGLWALRRDRRWLAVAAVTLFALCAAYQLPGARHLMLALPVVRRGLHHYIKLGLELGLALLAAAGLDSWIAGKRRGLLAGAAALLAALAGAWVRFGGAGVSAGMGGSGGPGGPAAPPRGSGEWRLHGLLHEQAAWTAWALALALLIVASLWLPAGWRRRLAPLSIALFAADLIAAHAPTNPGLSLAHLYPRTAAVRFLADKPGRVAGTGGALHPNAAMVYGLYDVRGDDSIKLQRYEELYAAHLGPGHPTFFQPMDRWQDLWLDRLGVRWVMTGPQDPPPVAAWRLAYAGADARIFERLTAAPLVRWLAPPAPLAPNAGGLPSAEAVQPGPSAAPPAVERREPGVWDVSWRTPVAATLEVAEVWDRGWSAEVAGAPRPVERVEGPLLGVRVGPGAGTLHLAYTPAGLGWGALISLLGVAATATLGLGLRRQRPASGSVSQ
jgi:hypothetical protein